MARRRRNGRNKTQDPDPGTGSKTPTPGKRSSGKTKKVTPRRRGNSDQNPIRAKRRSNSSKPTPRPRQTRSKPTPTSGPEDYFDPLWTETKPTVNAFDTLIRSEQVNARAWIKVTRLEDHETADGEVMEAGEVGVMPAATEHPELELDLETLSQVNGREPAAENTVHQGTGGPEPLSQVNGREPAAENTVHEPLETGRSCPNSTQSNVRDPSRSP